MYHPFGYYRRIAVPVETRRADTSRAQALIVLGVVGVYALAVIVLLVAWN